jgi:hypothetical protein
MFLEFIHATGVSRRKRKVYRRLVRVLKLALNCGRKNNKTSGLLRYTVDSTTKIL